MPFRMMILAAILSAAAQAHLSPEEARARMDAKARVAATQPVDRAELERLRRENAALKAEVAQLKERLARVAGPGGQNAAAPVKGPITALNAAKIQQLREQRLLDKESEGDVKLAMKQSGEIDRDVQKYLAEHELPERVKAAAMKGEPAPGMPEELLVLFGSYTVKSETEHSKVVSFQIYGFSQDSWDLTITDGKVFLQRKRDGEFGSYTFTPRR